MSDEWYCAFEALTNDWLVWHGHKHEKVLYLKTARS